MGWLRKRFGESNTAIGAGMLYMAALALLPQHAELIHAVASAAGVGLVVTPKA